MRAQRRKLYHLGIRNTVSRNTLANANKQRDWRIYADVAQELIRIARPMYADEDLGLDLDNTVFALDASTIDLCLSVFPWAPVPVHESRDQASTRCSTCAARFRRSCMCPTAKWPMFTRSTASSPSLGPSM